VSARSSAFTTQMDVVRAILESNLLGPFSLSQGLIGDRGYGRVVNVSSAMGQLSDMGGGAPGYRLACVGINAMPGVLRYGQSDNGHCRGEAELAGQETEQFTLADHWR
jgi:NAD(P)-dependent dehydrogenase (short-subunit alcohol dehydrogenase family)